MAASLCWCKYCPSGKKENKRTSKIDRRIYHKLLRRISKEITNKEYILYENE